MAKRVRAETRVVQAPEPRMLAGSLPLNRVLSVVLKPGEDVEWVWMSLPDGGNYVSGYRIIKARRRSVGWESTLREAPLDGAL